MTRGSEAHWDVRFFWRDPEDDPAESCPAEAFLDACPQKVARSLLAILQAVAESPPPSFTGGGMWEAMHGEMAGFYEARTRGPDRRLYRLYCLLERDRLGLDRPTVVVIAGLSKPHGTPFRPADYARVRQLAEEYRRHAPANLA